MNKKEFSERLMKGLSCLPKEDMEERVSFYSETIDDRMEEGYSEEEAVGMIGDVDELIRQIISETPVSRLVKKRVKPKRKIKTWEIALLALGSPIWLSLGLALIAVIFSLYVVLWSVTVSLWAVFISLAVSSVALIIIGAVLLFVHGAIGTAVISSGLICSGISIFMLLGCVFATKGIIVLTKKLTAGIAKKEEA